MTVTRRATLRWSAAALAATALAVASCGVDAGDRAPSATATTAAPAPEGAPPTTEPGATTSAPEPTDGPEAADDGTTFEGDGYLIDAGPTWTESDLSMARGIQFWSIGSTIGGLQPNVNVLVQDRTADTETLADYQAVSEDGVAGLDGELVSSEIVTGSEGQELFEMEFVAEQQGTELHFLAYAAEVEGGFALATFTAPAEAYDDVVGEVQPYLVTLRAS